MRFSATWEAESRYAGSPALTLDGKTTEVPVALRVWDVELPRETSYIGHMLVWNSPFARRAEVLKRFAECGMMGTVYNGGEYELVGDIFTVFVNLGVGLSYSSRRVVGYNALAVNQSGISLSYALPAVVAVHSVKSAHNRGKLAAADFL